MNRPATVSDGGVIREGYNKELDEFRSAATDGKRWVAELQAKEQERSGIKSLKINYNRVFGYFIEVTKTHLASIPDDYIRKQTLVNSERFITPGLKEMESKILGSEDKSKALEVQLFEELRKFAGTFTPQIQLTAGRTCRNRRSLRPCGLRPALLLLPSESRGRRSAGNSGGAASRAGTAQ